VSDSAEEKHTAGSRHGTLNKELQALF